MPDDLKHGREHYRRREWRKAFRSLSLADRKARLAIDDLERLASAAYLVGREPEFQALLRRAHGECVAGGDAARAAHAAFWLGLTLTLRGESAQGSGWLARAARLVEGVDCVERGYLLLPVAEQHLEEGRAEAAERAASAASRIGERFAEADLVACARHVEGRALIAQGRVRAGLALLDEAMLAVIAGELSPIMTGLVYCSVIATCQQVCASARAREWTDALAQWCGRQPEMVAFTGTCLVHRAELLQLHGAWTDAMAEACRESAPSAAALCLRAEVHRLRGEYAEAETAYRSAAQLGCEPQPGLALLRMAQGRLSAALAGIRRAVSAAGALQRVRLLPAHIEIALAAGARDEAHASCAQLEASAQAIDTEELRAMAAHARGALHLAEGDAGAALAALRRAFALWQRLEVPYQAARARVLIALACRSLGDHEAAALELQAARAAFEQLGAAPEIARLKSLEGKSRADAAHGLTRRELQVLRLLAAGRTNRRIAAELFLSERTIDRHVSNILAKLSVSSRAAATAYAHQHKLL